MQNLPESVVAAVGRMTVAATELEFVLAWIDAVAEAGDALGAGQATLRSMWTDGDPRTEARIDEVVVRLDASRERLGTLIDAQLGSRAGQP
jgi:hypothetical protein